LLALTGAAVTASAQSEASPTINEGDAPQPKSPQQEEAVEEIVVTGIRSGLEAALGTKRAASSIVDAISAEDIGKFPDENIAESLQRITGLSITRGFGEGEDVSIRGLGPGRNLTLLNGQGIASSSFLLENDEFSRGFNFSLLPSELVSSVTVFKSPEARLQEGGVGGTIVLKTRRPLDQPRLATAASLASGYSDLSNKLDLRATGLVSWKNEAETFGVLLSGVHQERSLRRDAVEVLSYEQSDIDVGGDGTLEGQNVFYPGLIGSALFRQKRVRTSGLATIEWKPIEPLHFTATGLISRLGGDNTNHNYLSLQFLAPMSGSDSVVNDAIIRNGTAFFLDLADGADTREIDIDSILRETRLLTYSVDLHSEWTAGAWSVSNQTGVTRATGGRGDLLIVSFVGDSAYTSDLRDGVGAANYDIDTTDPTTLDFANTERNNASGTQQQIYTQLDVERHLSNPVFASVQAGVKYRHQFQNRSREKGNLSRDGDEQLILPEGVEISSLASVPHTTTPDGFLDGVAGPNGLTQYAYPNIKSLSDALPISAYQFADDPDFFFRINEEIFAGYAQGNIESEIGDVGVRGNIGVRYVSTTTTSRARRQQDNEVAKLKDTHTYGEVLPSVNLSFDLHEDVVLRVASARVMNRPAYSELSQAVELNTTLFTGSGGNPDLEPMVANQSDVAGEWYFAEGSALSLALFYKDILSFVALQEMEEVYDGDIYRVTRPFNGRGGNTHGLEAAVQHTLTFLPGLLNGLGFLVNYTFADSTSSVEDPQTGIKLPLPGQSKHTVNVIGYYEKGPVGLRVAYNYRTKFFEQIDRGGARFSDAFGQLDANLSYDLLDGHLTVFAEGLNLTNQTLVRFVGIRARPYQHLSTGRRFFLGVRGHY
jgi:iron complex outermembrane receptor protein